MLRDKDWELPLHRAARSDAYLEVLHRLLQIFPEGTTKPDASGKLPVHHVPSREALAGKALRRAWGMPGNLKRSQGDETSCNPRKDDRRPLLQSAAYRPVASDGRKVSSLVPPPFPHSYCPAAAFRRAHCVPSCTFSPVSFEVTCNSWLPWDLKDSALNQLHNPQVALARGSIGSGYPSDFPWLRHPFDHTCLKGIPVFRNSAPKKPSRPPGASPGLRRQRRRPRGDADSAARQGGGSRGHLPTVAHRSPRISAQSRQAATLSATKMAGAAPTRARSSATLSQAAPESFGGRRGHGGNTLTCHGLGR